MSSSSISRAMKISPLALLSLAALPLSAFSQTAAIKPGDYILEGGMGHLSIKRDSAGKLDFAIESVGGNGHVCSLGGEIRKGKAVMTEEPNAGSCIVGFIPKGNGIAVTADGGEACRYYCGMRATFDGLYLKPAKGCDDPTRRRTRAEFKRLYDKKAYDEALAILAPVLEKCQGTLNNLESAWIRNDLALTQFKLGDSAACRRTLEPLAADAAMTDQEIRDNLPPADAENFLPIARATRTNLKLCGASALSR